MNRRAEHHIHAYPDGRPVQYVPHLYPRSTNLDGTPTFATITAHVPGVAGGEEVCLYLDLDSLCGLIGAAMKLRTEWPTTEAAA